MDVGRRHGTTRGGLLHRATRIVPDEKLHSIGGMQTLLGANERQVLNTIEIVPAGKGREYRVKADCYNWME